MSTRKVSNPSHHEFSSRIRNPKNDAVDEKFEQHARILSNCIKDSYRHLAPRFKRENIDVFRLYDRDRSEVCAVVDWYQGHLVVGEYVQSQTSPQWLPRMAQAAGEALKIPADKVFVKQRQAQAVEGARYRFTENIGKRFVVAERDMKLWVGLDGNLDTGLFSDHRDTRVLVRQMAKGQDFLNLFAYTSAFSCVAALGGAKSIVTVDRSATYLDWAKDNFKLNNIENDAYEFYKSDTEQCLEFLHRKKRKFTLAFVDPPSFSQRKKAGAFNVNNHHPQLLEKVFAVMEKGSTVIFSCNHQRFVPKFHKLKTKRIQELTPKTIPEDYSNKLIHRCWQIDL